MLTCAGFAALFMVFAGWVAGILGTAQTTTRIIIAVGAMAFLVGVGWSAIDPATPTSSSNDPGFFAYLR